MLPVPSRRRFELLLILLLSFTLLTEAFAVSPSSPVPISSFGVTALYQTVTSTAGAVTVHVSTSDEGVFYVEKLILFLDTASQVDIVLDSISINGVYVYSYSSFPPGTPRVTIVPAGSTMGDVISTMPAYLAPLIAKDPLGNNATFATGGDTNGLTVEFRYSSLVMTSTIMIMALVVAPSTSTVTLTVT